MENIRHVSKHGMSNYCRSVACCRYGKRLQHQEGYECNVTVLNKISLSNNTIKVLVIVTVNPVVLAPFSLNYSRPNNLYLSSDWRWDCEGRDFLITPLWQIQQSHKITVPAWPLKDLQNRSQFVWQNNIGIGLNSKCTRPLIWEGVSRNHRHKCPM